MPTNEQKERYARLIESLAVKKRVLVALSGGVDSSLLLYAANQALPGSVLAVTCATPYTPREEEEGAVALAQSLGVDYRVAEFPIPGELRHNPPDRCYLCKRLLFGRLKDMAAQAGIAHVLDGSNVDDLDDHRPGRRAVLELGVESPLMEAGMTKQDIRELARECGLGAWNRPAGACLLTRLPHETVVTEAELRRIDQGERLLRSLGFPAVRLRSHGYVARIELPRPELASFVAADDRHGIHLKLKDMGYRHVSLDLEGYRMGSLNQTEATR